MPLPAILNQVAGYMAAIEAAYGTAETLAGADDGIYPYLGDGLPPAPSELQYLYDGNLGRDVKTLFPTLGTSPNGRGAQTTFPALFKGPGTAYSTSAVMPPNEVHVMLQASGFDAAFTTDHWDYTPTAAGLTYKSITYGHYAQGKAHLIAGGLADWSFTFDGLGVPTHSFAIQGLGALPTTLSLPAITYQSASVIPPVAAGCTVTIGDFVTPVTKGGSFAMNRDLGGARARITASGGHLGFVPGGMRPEITLMIEQSALVSTPFHTSGGLAPDALREAATAIDVSVQFGTTSTNKWKITLNEAQCIKAMPTNDDNVAMWELTFRGTGSSAVAVLFD